MAIGETRRRKLTYEDYVLIPEDGMRHEILAGEHHVTPAPSEGHQAVLINLGSWIREFLRRRSLGRILPAPFDVLFSEHDIAQPDLLFVSNRRSGVVTEKYARGAPDLVVEILSRSTRRIDQGLKRQRYELAGVEEYWLIDPQRRTVRILRRDGAAFGPPVDLSAEAGDVLATPLLPGLQIPVGEIFEEDQPEEPAMAIGETRHRKLTYEDFLAFPDDGMRHEILDGKHYVTPSPTRGHQVAVRNLVVLVAGFLRRHPLGELLPAPFDVILSDHDVAAPDLLFISHRRAGILTEKNAQGAPDLVIEVLSDSTRRVDQGIKRAVYERSGVEEYWLADPQSRTVRVLRRDGAVFGPPADLSAERGDVLETPLLPGLAIPVHEVFG